jgi:CBS-domain-containing membrane protein
VLLLGLAVIEPWHLWLTSHGRSTATAEYDWHKVFHPHYLHEKFWRLRYALLSMERWIFAGDVWLLVPPLVAAALVLVAFRRPALALVIAGWLVAAFFGISLVFWIGRPDVGWYVGYAAFRIMTTLPIVACTAVPLLLGLAMAQRSRKRESAP